MEETKHKMHNFWSGGLDSVFRLTQSLMTTESIVQPHYFVDGEESTGFKTDAMNPIREEIPLEFPGVLLRFLRTIFVNSASIGRDEEIKVEVENLRKRQKVEEQ